MSILFTASDIFQFAIRMEENGERFYHHASQKTDDEKTKKIFTYLADEETNHMTTFEDMASGIEKYQPPESYPGEYLAYLRAYVDRIMFTEEEFEKALSNIKDASSAIEFAVSRELESILYYQEIKVVIPENQHSLIDKIIEEERKHFLQLSELKRG